MSLTLQPTDWFRLSPDETAQRLSVDPLHGLDPAEVTARLEQFGPNQLAESPRRPAWKRFLDQFKDLMVYILLGAAAVSLAVGDVKDPIVIGIVLSVSGPALSHLRDRMGTDDGGIAWMFVGGSTVATTGPAAGGASAGPGGRGCRSAAP